jgi:excisionase family DNA binding protein
MEHPIDKLIEKIIDDKFKVFRIEIEKLISKNESNDTKTIFDFEKACEFIGCSASYLYKKTSCAEIPHYKNGRRVYFIKESLEEWLLKNKVHTITEINEVADSFLHNIKTK